MVLTITIYDECDTYSDISVMLEEIKRLIDNGYTSGCYPGFEINGNEENIEEEP